MSINKIRELLNKKEEHITKHNNYVQYLAENRINKTFISGKCEFCEKIDNEIIKILNK